LRLIQRESHAQEFPSAGLPEVQKAHAISAPQIWRS
jgi:hypothetical protein